MKLGVIIKEIRISKKMSLKTLYKDIISRTFAYYFEKGQNDIKTDSLLKILKRLNISLNELVFIASEYTYRPHSSIGYDIGEALNNSIDQLHQIFEQYYDSDDSNEKLFGALSYSVYAINKGLPLNDDVSYFIKEYFFQIAEWTLYDIDLFQYALVVFNDDLPFLEAIMKDVMNKLEIYYLSDFEIEKTEMILAETFMNYTQVYIMDKKIQEGTLWQSEILQKFPDLRFIDSKLNMRCATLLLEFFDPLKREDSIKEYFYIVNFLKNNLSSDFNLERAGVFFERQSKEYITENILIFD